MNFTLISSWILSVAVIVLGVMWFFGKGLKYIAGSTSARAASKQRRHAAYQARLGKVCGAGMILLGLQLCVYCAFEFTLPAALSWIVPWGLLGTLLLMILVANLWAKK